MLVLSRYCDESIYIGDDVVVTIVDIRGDRVRLGIQAPAHISVHRKEIYDAIVREQAQEGEEHAPKPKKSPPFAKQLAARKGKGLPVDVEVPGFGGVSSDIVTQ